MQSLLERGFAAQLRDPVDMELIYAMTASGVPPDYACSSVVKKEGFQLSQFIKDTLSAPASLGDAVGSKSAGAAKTKENDK